MRTKLLLAAAGTVAVLGVGSAIAWGASSQPGPAVWSHDVASGPAKPATFGQAVRGMGAMHGSLAKADLDQMVKACQKAMKDGAMMDADDMMSGDLDDMMDDGGTMGDAEMMGDADMMGDAGMMGDDADMMGAR